MKFKPFKMAQFSAQWPSGNLKNMHSSNPQPWRWDELGELLQTDLTATLSKTPFAYESVQGNQRLREQLSHHYHAALGPDDITLTSGAQEGIFLLMHALLEPGDHVITFSPCFEPLVQVAMDVGAQVSVLPLDESSGWTINWDLLRNSISDNTKLVVINFPHNPTGTHISETALQQLVDLCEKHHCWLFSDEVFRGLEHHPNDRISSAADLYDRAISMGVVSKALALPGVRLGWLACQHADFISQLTTVKSHLSICQSSLDAQLCQAIIPHSELLWQRSITTIKHNKAILSELLAANPHFNWHKPKASATAFIQCIEQNALDLCSRWANDLQLLLMPNQVFLTQQAGFRLTLGMPEAHSTYEQIFRL